MKPGPGVISLYCRRSLVYCRLCQGARKTHSTAREVNDSKPWYVIEQVIKAADEFKHPVIGCLGLSFKADIDDLRESPALAITETLSEKFNGKILAVEPNIKALPAHVSDKIDLVSLTTAVEKCHILVILVDHKQFKQLRHDHIAKKVVIDTRGLLSV